MGSTYISFSFHAVFCTKDRFPCIDASWRPRLHAYLGGSLRTVDAMPLAIGGTNDHVHLLFGLNTSHRFKDVMREIKRASSRWVHQELNLQPFSWQEGYSAFTVSPTAVDSVRSYIANQEEHHRRKTFREELIKFLETAGIEYDPKFLE